MQPPNRRTFLNVAGLAAGGGLVGAASGGALDLFAQAPAQAVMGFPTRSSIRSRSAAPKRCPIIGRLPGARRMYVLPSRRASTTWSAAKS